MPETLAGRNDVMRPISTSRSDTSGPALLVKEARRVCEANGVILIVNHFSGRNGWRPLEQMLKNLATKIGFHSDFPYAEHNFRHDWEISKVEPVNLFGLSGLIVIRNN